MSIYTKSKAGELTCWICQEKIANSREHYFKKSDLKQCYKIVNQENPIYKYNHDQKRVKIIYSYDSKDFTFHTKICSDCNGSLTQPYDFSWEQLSEYFFKNHNRLKRRNVWIPKTVFKGHEYSSMLNVHLYFLKIFGCNLKDQEKNFSGIDLQEISLNLLHNFSNRNFYIRFGYNPNVKSNIKESMRYPLLTLEKNGSNKKLNSYASTVYSIGALAIDLCYCKYGNRVNLSNQGYWNPDEPTQNQLAYFRNTLKL